MDSNYNIWKKSIEIAGLTFDDYNLYKKNIHLISRKCQTKYSKVFYEERYGWLYDTNTIHLIYENNVKEIKKNRINIYDPIQVAQKMGIDENAALELVQKRKEATAGTLENFIKRHGDSGVEKFKEFGKKSSHTLKKYCDKYGAELGTEKFNEYRKKKSSSLDQCILRHGDKLGTSKYTNANAKRQYTSSLEGRILKYGEEKGRKIYESECKNREVTLDKMISKYGVELGTEKFNSMNLKKAYAMSLEYHIEKYGIEEGTKKHKLKNIAKSPIFFELRKKYQYDEALSLYEKANSKKFTEAKNKAVTKMKSNFFRPTSNKNNVSKQSREFFDRLKRYTNLDLIYGSRSSEKTLFDCINNCKYYYDCFCESENLLIEYNGVAYHPKEGDVQWVNPYGTGYDSIRAKDLAKKQCAEKNGYRYIEIWSDVPFIENLKIINDTINENKKNNK